MVLYNPHQNCRMYETKPIPSSYSPSLFILLLFFQFFSTASTFDVLQKTIAGASVLFYDSELSLANMNCSFIVVSVSTSIHFNSISFHSKVYIAHSRAALLSDHCQKVLFIYQHN